MGVLDRIEVDRERLRERDPWYLKIPALAQLSRDGLDLDAGVTVVVGENGAGKSTFVEAVAAAWHARLRAAVTHWSPPRSAEDTDLHWALVLHGERPVPHGGCFLRAESMHTLFASVDRDGAGTRLFGGELNARSHGESFLAYLESRLTERGLFLLDEPEAALSFTSCLRLLAILDALARNGSQVVLATHSPVLAALPGAAVIQFDEAGFHRSTWDELELVEHWRTFLGRPQLYLRHLL